MLGQRCSPLLFQCQSSVYDAGPTLIQHWVCCILRASISENTWHSPNTVSILTHSLRRWPNIETEFADCPEFVLTGMRVTLYSLEGHNSDKLIYWHNFEIMSGRCLRPSATLGQHYSNQKPFSGEYSFFLNFFKTRKYLTY